MTKKILIILITGALSFNLFGGNLALAQIELINPLGSQTFEQAIGRLIDFLFFLAIALAPLMIIYAAFLMLTGVGNAVQTNKGKNIIFWAIVALVIVFLAKGLPSIIRGAMGG